MPSIALSLQNFKTILNIKKLLVYEENFSVISSFIFISYGVHAQKGNNQISIGPEVDFPVGTFGDAYKLGFGGTIKGLYGIGSAGQITFTTGYIGFKVKAVCMRIKNSTSFRLLQVTGKTSRLCMLNLW